MFLKTQLEYAYRNVAYHFVSSYYYKLPKAQRLYSLS